MVVVTCRAPVDGGGHFLLAGGGHDRRGGGISAQPFDLQNESETLEAALLLKSAPQQSKVMPTPYRTQGHGIIQHTYRVYLTSHLCGLRAAVKTVLSRQLDATNWDATCISLPSTRNKVNDSKIGGGWLGKSRQNRCDSAQQQPKKAQKSSVLANIHK